MSTNSAPHTARPALPGKRERLVASAVELLHEQGVQRTTLAEIAQAAEVPVGNVYYYFKTKDELVAAAIEAHAAQLRTTLVELERHRSPRARLKAFVATITAQRELVARYGCPHGTLCSELDKRDDPLSSASAELMRISIEWVEDQFRQLGREDAAVLALALIASYQGISLLTNTFRDPTLMAREGKRLAGWIDSLAAPVAARAAEPRGS